jgi:hypothetical protein
MQGEVKGGISFRRLRVLIIAAIALGCFAPQPGGALQGQKTHGDGRVVAFRWFPAVAGQQTVRVFADTEVAIPIEAEVEGNISEVIFEIPSKFKTFGIAVEKPFSAVQGGKARSKVLFRIIGGMPLGRHDLVVHILERSSKAGIGIGSIPFIILPSDLECLC